MIHFQGLISVKKTFLWADRQLVLFGDRIEVSIPDRLSSKIALDLVDISVSPIIRHHGSFEFTVFTSGAGYFHRLRLRMPQLLDCERLHGLILKVKGVYVEETRNDRPLGRPLRLVKKSRASLATSDSVALEGSPGYANRSSGASPRRLLTRKGSVGYPCQMFHVYSADNPHFSINLAVALLITLAALIAPLVRSFTTTMAVTVFAGLGLAFVINTYSIEVPHLHFIVTLTPSAHRRLPETAITDGFPDVSEQRRDSLVSSTMSVETRRPVGSGSYIESPGLKLNLDELEVQSVASVGEIERPVIANSDGKIEVLFSKSSKFLSQFASKKQYLVCYSVMHSAAELVVKLLQSQPAGIAPPQGISLLVPGAVKLDLQAMVVADDAAHTESQWSVIRSKNGLKVLTSKLGPSLARWPVISSVGTVKSDIASVYKTVAVPEVFKKVDEFAGDYRLVEYVEVASVTPSKGFSSERASSGSESSLASLDKFLSPETAPVLIKYQEMKSVWPVKPRDYLAGQTGFDVVLEGDSTRRGKLLIAKSVDPCYNDPFPAGHDGFVRGGLTASVFLILQNEADPKHSDVWTFLHCDLKGNLSGNGKIADFITQSQMPKFFAKLEAVASAVADDI